MYQIPLQHDADHLTVALWRAKVWLNERSRKAYRPQPAEWLGERRRAVKSRREAWV